MSDKAELALGGSSEKQISKDIFQGRKFRLTSWGVCEEQFVSPGQGPQYVV